MADEDAAGIVSGIRQAMQDLLAPELREMRADLRAIRERLDTRFDTLDRRFDRMEDQLNTHRDVQVLKEQMAELRAKQQPSA